MSYSCVVSGKIFGCEISENDVTEIVRALIYFLLEINFHNELLYI